MRRRGIQWWNTANALSMCGVITHVSNPNSKTEWITNLLNLTQTLTLSPSCKNILGSCAYLSCALSIFITNTWKSMSYDDIILHIYSKTLKKPLIWIMRTTSNSLLTSSAPCIHSFDYNPLVHILVWKWMIFRYLHRKIYKIVHIMGGVMCLTPKPQWCHGHGI